MAVKGQTVKNTSNCSCTNAREIMKDGDLGAYRCDKLWGLYHVSTGKEITKPVFTYVLPSPYGYLVVESNKVGYYAANGTIIVQPGYKKLGFVWNNSEINEFLYFQDDSTYAGAAVTEKKWSTYVKKMAGYDWNGNQLNNLHCRMLEVKNGRVIVNNYDFNITNDTGYEQWPQSGLYNLETGKWDIPRTYMYLVALDYKYIGLISATSETHPHAFNYRVYDENFKYTDIEADPLSHEISVDEIAKLLPYRHITNVQLRMGPFMMGGLYSFETNGKTGLFSLSYLQIIQPPVYDAIFAPTSTQYMFSVMEHRVGLMDPYSSGSVLQPVYDSIWAGGLRDEENTGNGILLNGKWYVLLGLNTTEEVVDSVWKDYKRPYASVYCNGQQVMLHDVTPTFYGTDPIRVMRGVETADSLDNSGNPVYPPPVPGKNLSGIYDITLKKWIVPHRYNLVGTAGAYYYGALNSGNIKLFDLYDAAGNLVMPNLSAYMEITSPTIWSSITGHEKAVRTHRVECDTAVTTHALHNAVYVYAEQGMGVFDLGKMKWLIEPRYIKLSYSAEDQKFRATPIDKPKTTVLFDKTGMPIKK